MISRWGGQFRKSFVAQGDELPASGENDESINLGLTSLFSMMRISL